MKQKISAILVVHDEEDIIKRPLESIKEISDVVRLKNNMSQYYIMIMW